MIQAQIGDTVIIHYKLSFKDGRVHAQTLQDQPIKVTLGARFLLPGVEEVIIGMTLGEVKTVTLPYQKAYGPRFDDLIKTLPKSQFPAHVKTSVGSRISITTEEGKVVEVTVIKETDHEVTLDANPFQAGKDMVLYVELVGFD